MLSGCQHKIRFKRLWCCHVVNGCAIVSLKMNRKLTNRLAECRAAKGMNKSKLAFRLKMTRGYVTRLERGDIRPKLETAIRIAQIFGQPVESIFQLIEEHGKT